MDEKFYIALNNNVFVKEIKQEARHGSMLLPDNINNDFKFGEVISVAEGYFEHGSFIPSAIKAGDIVVFPKIAGTQIDFNKIPMIKVAQQDIIAKQVIGTLDID